MLAEAGYTSTSYLLNQPANTKGKPTTMHIMDAQKIIVASHHYALQRGERASTLHLEGRPGTAKSEGTTQSCEWLCRLINEPVGLVIDMLATKQGVDMIGFMLPVKGPTGTLDTMFSTPPWMPTPENIWVVVPPRYDGPGATDASAASEHPTWFTPGTWIAPSLPIPRVGVVFFDEWAQAEDDVRKPAAEIILNGRIGTRALPVGWRVLSASNHTSDRSGVLREMMFIINRRCLLRIEMHAPSWLNWGSHQPDYNRPHYLTLSFAQQHPGVVFRDSVPDGTDPYCTPRSLTRMDRDIRALCSQEEIAANMMPLSDLAREYATGWIGAGAAAQYYTHLKYADRLPTLEEITQNPSRAKLPSERDVQMVCSYMIAHHINNETVEPLFTYMNRMVAEMQILCVRVARSELTRSKLLQTTPGFSQWLINNKDVLEATAI